VTEEPGETIGGLPMAQSPAGRGCEARFPGLRLEPVTLGGLRDGT
jgi:hypothetical protein